MKISYSSEITHSFDGNNFDRYSGCEVRTIFEGSSIEVVLEDDSRKNLFTVVLDDSTSVLKTNRNDTMYLLDSVLKEWKHTLKSYGGPNSTAEILVFQDAITIKTGTLKSLELGEGR